MMASILLTFNASKHLAPFFRKTREMAGICVEKRESSFKNKRCFFFSKLLNNFYNSSFLRGCSSGTMVLMAALFFCVTFFKGDFFYYFKKRILNYPPTHKSNVVLIRMCSTWLKLNAPLDHNIQKAGKNIGMLLL